MGRMKVILAIGVVSLIIGGFLTFTSGNKSKDNLDIALNATNAQEAAELISRNNRSEVGQNTLGMGLLLLVLKVILAILVHKVYRACLEPTENLLMRLH